MTLEVLKSRGQVARARAEMKRRGIDCASSLAERSLRRLRLLPGVDVGDRRKSWDVLKTVRFIEERFPKESAILDIGAHSCEVLPILHRLGYAKLTGVDLNPGIGDMPHPDAIRYISADFMRVPCADACFDCVTAISVIEHGFDPERLLGELSRLLKPGGCFVASVDYWPQKIDTTGIDAYGMSWIIFSREELRDFMAKAKGHGFEPVGAADFEADERVAHWMNRDYTFAWMALRKVSSPS